MLAKAADRTINAEICEVGATFAYNADATIVSKANLATRDEVRGCSGLGALIAPASQSADEAGFA
jgi:hypothetical protein